MLERITVLWFLVTAVSPKSFSKLPNPRQVPSAHVILPLVHLHFSPSSLYPCDSSYAWFGLGKPHCNGGLEIYDFLGMSRTRYVSIKKCKNNFLKNQQQQKYGGMEADMDPVAETKPFKKQGGSQWFSKGHPFFFLRVSWNLGTLEESQLFEGQGWIQTSNSRMAQKL